MVEVLASGSGHDWAPKEEALRFGHDWAPKEEGPYSGRIQASKDGAPCSVHSWASKDEVLAFDCGQNPQDVHLERGNYMDYDAGLRLPATSWSACMSGIMHRRNY